MVYRILAAGVVAMFLLCAPVQLAAMEKEAPATDRAIEWLSGVWEDLATWWAEKTVLPPPENLGEDDGGCWIDPNGSTNCG